MLIKQNAKNNIIFQKNFVFKQVKFQNNLLVFLYQGSVDGSVTVGDQSIA